MALLLLPCCCVQQCWLRVLQEPCGWQSLCSHRKKKKQAVNEAACTLFVKHSIGNKRCAMSYTSVFCCGCCCWVMRELLEHQVMAAP